MTRKDHIAIANLIHDLPMRIDKAELISQFTKFCVKDNPRFSVDKFIAACLGFNVVEKLDFKDQDAVAAEQEVDEGYPDIEATLPF